MNLYIHEWPDNTATLTVDNGASIFTFTSLTSAIEASDNCYHEYDRVVIQQSTQDLSCSTLC